MSKEMISKENRTMLRGEFEYMFPPQRDYTYNEFSDMYYAPDHAPSSRFYAQQTYNELWQKYQKMRFENLSFAPIAAEGNSVEAAE